MEPYILVMEDIGHRLGNVWPVPDVKQHCQRSKMDDRKRAEYNGRQKGSPGYNCSTFYNGLFTVFLIVVMSP